MTFSFGQAALFDLTGKTALVTGGSSGIGLGLARALGLAGARLILVARGQGGLARAAAELRELDLDVQTIAADLADAEMAQHIKAGLMAGASPDILINAAGINLRQPFGAVDAASFDLHMAVHLRAPFLLTQLLAPVMAERGSGRIINIASLQSTRAMPNCAPYGAAKGGVVQLTRAIAEEWSPRGVTCNAIAPGFIETPLTRPLFADWDRVAHLTAQTPAGRLGRPSDMDGAVIFLAGSGSAYVTGQTLYVDGGYSAC